VVRKTPGEHDGEKPGDDGDGFAEQASTRPMSAEMIRIAMMM
jgi:hypothetical protein